MCLLRRLLDHRHGRELHAQCDFDRTDQRDLGIVQHHGRRSHPVAFTTQPGGGANGATWTTQPEVSVEDSGGNAVTGATASITLALAPSPRRRHPRLHHQPQDGAAGVATFAGCKITGVGGLHADRHCRRACHRQSNHSPSPPGRPPSSSSPPSRGRVDRGVALPTQPVVSIEDSGGNVVTGNTNAVNLAIVGHPDRGHAHLHHQPQAPRPVWPPSPDARSRHGRDYTLPRRRPG